jgi:3-oxoacyl-[acyl-carrier protein] reductase
MIAMIPSQKLGLPEDVAALVCFLASDLAGYITGQVIHINGGLYM